MTELVHDIGAEIIQELKELNERLDKVLNQNETKSKETKREIKS